MLSMGDADVLFQVTEDVINDMLARIWNAKRSYDPRSQDFFLRNKETTHKPTLSREFPEITCDDDQKLLANVKLVFPPFHLDGIKPKVMLSTSAEMTGSMTFTTDLQGVAFWYFALPQPNSDSLVLKEYTAKCLIDTISIPNPFGKDFSIPVEAIPFEKIPFADKLSFLWKGIQIHEPKLELPNKAKELQPLIALWLEAPIYAMPLMYQLASIPLVKEDHKNVFTGKDAISMTSHGCLIDKTSDPPLITIGYQIHGHAMQLHQVTKVLPEGAKCNAAFLLSQRGLNHLLAEQVAHGSLHGQYRPGKFDQAISWRWDTLEMRCQPDRLLIMGNLEIGSRYHPINHRFSCAIEDSGQLQMTLLDEVGNQEDNRVIILQACHHALYHVLASPTAKIIGRQALWQRFQIPTTGIAVDVAASHLTLGEEQLTLGYYIPPFQETPEVEIHQEGIDPDQPIPGALVSVAASATIDKGQSPYFLMWWRKWQPAKWFIPFWIPVKWETTSKHEASHEFIGHPRKTTARQEILTTAVLTAFDSHFRHALKAANLHYIAPASSVPNPIPDPSPVPDPIPDPTPPQILTIIFGIVSQIFTLNIPALGAKSMHFVKKHWHIVVPMFLVAGIVTTLSIIRNHNAQLSFGPSQFTWQCATPGDVLVPQSMNIDNSQSSRTGFWHLHPLESDTWASFDQIEGKIAARQRSTITITPDPKLCTTLYHQGQTVPLTRHIEVTSSLATITPGSPALGFIGGKTLRITSKTSRIVIIATIVPPPPTVDFQITDNDERRNCDSQLDALAPTTVQLGNSKSTIRVKWSAEIQGLNGQLWGKVSAANGLSAAGTSSNLVTDFNTDLCQQTSTKNTRDPIHMAISVTWQAVGSDGSTFSVDSKENHAPLPQGKRDVDLTVIPAFASVTLVPSNLTFDCSNALNPVSQSVSLNNTASTIPVGWTVTEPGSILHQVATAVDHTTGTISAGQKGAFTIQPVSGLCQKLRQQGIVKPQVTTLKVHWQAGKIGVHDINVPLTIIPPTPIIGLKDIAFTQQCGAVLSQQQFTLDNSQGTLAIQWTFQSADSAQWATLSNQSGTINLGQSGMIGAGQSVSLTVTPSPMICQNLFKSSQGATRFHLSFIWKGIGSDGVKQVTYTDQNITDHNPLDVSDTIKSPAIYPSAYPTTFTWTCGQNTSSQITIDNTKSTVDITVAVDPQLNWASINTNPVLIRAGEVVTVTLSLNNSGAICGSSQTPQYFTGNLDWSTNGLNDQNQFPLQATVAIPTPIPDTPTPIPSVVIQ